MKNDFIFNKNFYKPLETDLSILDLDLDLVEPSLLLGQPDSGPSRIGGLIFLKTMSFPF